MDNFFTSIPLAEYLYKVGTYVTGSIRRNRKFIPLALKEKFQVGEERYYRSRHNLAVREKISAITCYSYFDEMRSRTE